MRTWTNWFRSGTVLLVVLFHFLPVAPGAEFHVAPDGNDANPGTERQPLARIQAGVDKLQPGDLLLVHGGTYREMVVFSESGTAEQPITVRPFGDGKVIVSGCDPVTQWKKHSDRVWKAPMAWTLGLGCNQLFCDGVVLIEARHPNTPAPGLEMYVSDLSPLWPTFGEFSIPAETRVTEPGRIVSHLLDGQPDDFWKGAMYYGVHYEGWCGQTGVISGSKSGEIQVEDRTRGWWFGSAYGGKYPKDHEEGRGMIVGHLHALDQPGEWHWEDGVLYLIPPAGLKPTKARIEAKKRQLTFDLSGREHIHLTGLHSHAGSMRLQDASHSVIDDCHLRYVSHYTRHYGIGQIEHGRDTIRSGETGIFVGGHDNAFLNCSICVSAGAGFHLRGYHHTIHNCLIDEVSYTSHYLNAITDAVSDFVDYENMLVGGHVITHNTMRNAGRHFFNFYGNGTSTASRDRGPMDYMATLFAHNHVYNGMLQTRDAGMLTGYYSSGGTLNGHNSQVIYNVLHDSYDLAAMRWGVLGIIYLDAGTCDVDLHHNLLWAAPGSVQRGLWYNTMCVDIRDRDNVFHPGFTRTCAELTPSDFPEGRPFCFGHNFKAPSPVPQWPPLSSRSLALPATSKNVGGNEPAESLPLHDGDCLALGTVDFSEGWRSAVLRFAGEVKGINSDKSARVRPRHQKATDPLVLEATQNDGVQEEIRKRWSFLYNTNDRSWIRFNAVPMGHGYQRFRVIYGNSSSNRRWAEVHVDSVDGPLVGQVALPQTDQPRKGSIQIYREAVGQLSEEATGTHDLFFVFRSEDGQDVGAFEYFRLEQYRNELPLQKNEVKLELRTDDKNGPKIGEFYPRFTGGSDSFRQFVARLEPVESAQPLVLVVRSAVPGPIGAIDRFTLQKAAHPASLAGVGLAPRTDRQGKMVLPEATHLPQSRPGERFIEERLARRGPQPLAAAIRLQAAVAIDGRLDEWNDVTRHIELRESFDGSETTVPVSNAWVAYDDEALYVAARHAVEDMGSLRDRTHRSAPTEYMEVCFQVPDEDSTPVVRLLGYPDGHFVCGGLSGEHGEVSYRAGLEADGWVAEWRIPFSACGFTPREAPDIAFNVSARHMAGDSWAVWRGTGSAPSEVGRAGTLLFPDEYAAASSFSKEGLIVWFDAADMDTVTRDDDGRVAAWDDKSGRGNHARQGNSRHRPTYVLTAMNGRPSIRFNEKSATRLELSDLSDEKISATIFVVLSNPARPSEANHHSRLFTTSDGKAYDYQVGLCAMVPGLETGGPRQMMSVFEDRWARKARIGCFSPSYQTYFTGDIAEILVYDRVLSVAEQQRVRAYLLSKWGL